MFDPLGCTTCCRILQRRFAGAQFNQKGDQGIENDHGSFYDAEFFLDAPQKATVRQELLRFGRHFQWLSSDALLRGILLWHLRPKFHAMQHLFEQIDLINPRFVQCYLEEGLCGKVACIFKTSANGPQSTETIQWTAPIKILVMSWIRMNTGIS